MGATRLGGAGDRTVGEWEEPSAPGGARAGAGRAPGFPSTHSGCSRERGCITASVGGVSVPSRALVAGSQAGGNRTWCLRALAAPLRRAPFRPPPGASRQLRAGPAARGDAADRSAWVRACPGGAGPRLRAKGPGGGCAMSCS